MLEYDNIKGFRCQRCSDWTLGGRLYPTNKGERVCFLCHMDDVSTEMLKRFESMGSSLKDVEITKLNQGNSEFKILEIEDLREDDPVTVRQTMGMDMTGCDENCKRG